MNALYDDNGYVNVPLLANAPFPFKVLIGGRGIGKTYGVLKYYYDALQPIVYMRRTAEQMRISASPNFTPYKALTDDYYIDKGVVKTLCTGEHQPLAYFTALSTIANVRGFDASDCPAIVYDEFIPETTARPIRDEGEALLNAYETINRNREFQGKPATQLWLLSNSNTIYSPILAELQLLKTVQNMTKKHKSVYTDKKRGLLVCLFQDSPISEKKKETALYKLSNSTYSEMAINNTFRDMTTTVKSKNLNGYRPVVQLGEFCVYQGHGRLYVTPHVSGTPPKYGVGATELKRFRRDFGAVIENCELGYTDYETIETEYHFNKLLQE